MNPRLTVTPSVRYQRIHCSFEQFKHHICNVLDVPDLRTQLFEYKYNRWVNVVFFCGDALFSFFSEPLHWETEPMRPNVQVK